MEELLKAAQELIEHAEVVTPCSECGRARPGWTEWREVHVKRLEALSLAVLKAGR